MEREMEMNIIPGFRLEKDLRGANVKFIFKFDETGDFTLYL